MERIVHDLLPDSPEWHAFRLEHDGASEAAAMLGLSKTVTRTELLEMKSTGTAREFSDFVQKHVLDKGKEVEAKARPIAAEIVGSPLYPVTCSIGRTSASTDGLDMADEVAWEHKLINQENAPLVRAGQVPEEHMPQCQQALMVTGAERLLFMVSDGTRENMAYVWVEPDTNWFDRLRAGWLQFNKERETFVKKDIKEMPKAEVTVSLPALFIHATGEITTSNMKEYGVALAARLEEVRAITLVTDQDFSNAKESAKLLRENIEQAKLAKDAMLAQTVTVGEAARMIDAWCEDMRLTALQLEKDVEREDKAKKAAMVAATKELYDAHLLALNTEIAPLRMPITPPVFGEVIKGKRNYASMQDALDTALANGKITADEMVKQIRTKNAWYLVAAKGHETLFADLQFLIQKPMDDFQLAVKTRVDAQVAKEQKLRDDAAAEALAKPAVHPEQAADELFDKHHPPVDQPVPVANVVPMRAGTGRAAPSTPTLKLGDLNALIAPLSLTADGLTKLGFPPAATVQNAKMYHQRDLAAMVKAMHDHLDKVPTQQAA
jgi:predicted phage-related endonuclease